LRYDFIFFTVLKKNFELSREEEEYGERGEAGEERVKKRYHTSGIQRKIDSFEIVFEERFCSAPSPNYVWWRDARILETT